MKAIAHFATLLLPFPFLIWQFVVFDRLVRLEYEKFRAAWEHDGCPPGFFWSPPRSDRDTAPTLSRIGRFPSEHQVRWLSLALPKITSRRIGSRHVTSIVVLYFLINRGNV